MCYFLNDSFGAQISQYMIYSNLSSASVMLSLMLFPILAFLILQHSKQLGRYKWYILAHSTSSIGYELALWSLKPFSLFPATSIGICGIARDMPVALEYAQLMVFVICWINVSVTLSLSVTYRCFALFPGILNRIFMSKPIMVLYIFGTLLLDVLFAGPVVFLYKSPSQLHQIFTTDYPNLYPLYIQQNSRLIALESSPSSFVYSGFLTGFYVIYYVIGCFIFGFFTYRLVRYTQTSTNKQLTSLQWMLFRAMTVQIAIELTFLITPTFVLIIAYHFQLAQGSLIANTCLMLTSVHVWLDYMCLLYFIRPYRSRLETILNRLWNLRKKVQKTSETVQNNHQINVSRHSLSVVRIQT